MNIEDRVNRMSMDLDKLLEKASLWQSLFDECPIAIAVFTSEMKFHIINDAFTEMTGWTENDVIANKIDMVIPQEFKKSHKKHEKNFIEKPQKKVNRHGLRPMIVCKNGSSELVDIDLSFIIYDSRIYYVSFIRRISSSVL